MAGDGLEEVLGLVEDFGKIKIKGGDYYARI